MWKDYSSGYIKNNRSFGISMMAAAFIASLLLSLLGGMFYNVWKYEIERIEREEGSWQSRITGITDGNVIESIKNFASVKKAVVSRETGEEETSVDIYFDHMGSVFADTPRIAKLAGAAPEQVVYNYELLAMYLIRSPSDPAPRMLFPLFLIITGLAACSLVVVIHNSFAVSMNARIHQFGILSGIGATPKQIRTCLLQEAAALCTIPVIAGNLLGIAGSMGLLQIINAAGNDVKGRYRAVFGYHPLVFALTILLTVLTIWISAWIPAARLSRLTPLEAVRNTGELQLKRRNNAYILAFLAGVKGELAGNALKAQKKALRTTSLSLVLSFLAYTIMQCFFCISGISTRETYFERYQGVWDIMVTVADTDVEAFEKTQALQALEGAKSVIVYQKAAAKRLISEKELDPRMKSFGGFSHASKTDVTKTEDGWLVNAPVFILDDQSFLAYCKQTGIPPRLDGAVIRNRIRDVTNPDFRHPDQMPYVTGEKATSILRQSGNEKITAEVPVLAYTEQEPPLREEYATLDYYELVHFIPVSLWKDIKGQIRGTQKDISICVLGTEHASSDQLDALQSELQQIIGHNNPAEYENRVQEYAANERQIQGLRAVFGGFCFLLAVIGISNVFSNTMGFVRQRKREFARYLSIGMTPEELGSMFCMEAFVIAARPVLITLMLSVIAVGYMLKMSYLSVEEFLAEAPLIPVVIFMLAVLCFVVLAYYAAWRQVRKMNLVEVLRDDTMI